jgi:general secretion pathway protein I
MRRSSSAGFTLLEVMVALTIVAIALSAMITATGKDASDTAYLRDRTFAHWVAMNQINQMLGSREFPNPGRHDGSESLAGKEWFFLIDVERTQVAAIRRIDIKVRGNESKSAPVLARLSGFYEVVEVRPQTEAAEPEEQQRQPDDEPQEQSEDVPESSFDELPDPLSDDPQVEP